MRLIVLVHCSSGDVMVSRLALYLGAKSCMKRRFSEDTLSQMFDIDGVDDKKNHAWGHTGCRCRISGSIRRTGVVIMSYFRAHCMINNGQKTKHRFMDLV